MTKTKFILLFLTLLCGILLIFKYIEYQNIFHKEKDDIPENDYTSLFYELKKREIMLDCTAFLLVEAVGIASFFISESVPFLVLFYFFILYFFMNAKRSQISARWRCPHCNAPLAAGHDAGNIQLLRRCRSCGKRLY